MNAVLWIIEALSSAIKRNDPLPPHTGMSHCFFNRIAICALPDAQDSRDGLTSRFTRRTPAMRHIHVKKTLLLKLELQEFLVCHRLVGGAIRFDYRHNRLFNLLGPEFYIKF